MTTETTKKQNYSDLQVKSIVEMFTKENIKSFEDVKACSETLALTPVFAGDKTPRQIASKALWLSKQQNQKPPVVYVAKEYIAKTGNKPILKSVLISKLSNLSGISEDNLSSLESATKDCIQKLIKAFENMNDEIQTLESEIAMLHSAKNVE